MAVNTYFWPFKPNWKTPLTETFKWYTTVFRSRSGYEQRRGLRDGNRRGIEYDFLLKEEDAQLMDNLLLKAKAQAFWVPDWQYKCVTTADVAVGSTVIPGDVTYCPFKADADIDGNDALGVVLYRDRDTYELHQVSAVTDTQLTLTAPTTRAWPKGTTFYPYGKARLMGNVPLKRLSDRVTQGRVTTENYPGERGSYIPWGFYAGGTPAYEADHPTDTLDGREILLTHPNWKDGIDTTYEFIGDVVDEDIGAIEQFTTEEFGTVTRPMRWLLKTRRDVLRFKEFLGRRWGRRQSFYMPSWTSDLTVMNPVAATDTSMICKNTGAGALTGTADVSRDWVLIRTVANGDHYRRLTVAALDTTSTTYNLLNESNTPTPLGFLLLPSNVKAIHFISAYRLVSDEVSLTWYTDQVAVAELQVMTVAGMPESVPVAGGGSSVVLNNHSIVVESTGAAGDTLPHFYITTGMNPVPENIPNQLLNFYTNEFWDIGMWRSRVSVDAGAQLTMWSGVTEWWAGVGSPVLADYEIRLSVVSGFTPDTFSSPPLGTWVSMATEWGLQFYAENLGGTDMNAVWLLEIRDAATDEVLASSNLTILLKHA